MDVWVRATPRSFYLSQKDLATWQPDLHTHIYPGQTEILTIYSTILSPVNSITSTRSTHLSFGLSQSQAHASNCPHLSKAHSPLFVYTDVQHKGGPGEGFCVGTFKCLMINGRGGKKRARKRRRKGGREE